MSALALIALVSGHSVQCRSIEECCVRRRGVCVWWWLDDGRGFVCFPVMKSGNEFVRV